MHKWLPPLLCLALAGCTLGGGNDETASTTTVASTAPTTSVAEPPQLPLTVFRVHGGALHAESETVRGTAVARASLEALGHDVGVTIEDKTARVDLDEATPAETAEIVYTLTQYPSIQRVDVAGQTGLTRDDVAEFVPPVLIEAPASGARSDAAIRVAGTASVYEATLTVELRQDGKLVQKKLATASEGAPGRGTFVASLTAPEPGDYVVAVYSPSAVDGSAQHEQDVRVTVTP